MNENFAFNVVKPCNGSANPNLTKTLGIQIENPHRLPFYRNNQRFYGQMDSSSGFSAQNRSGITSPEVLIVVESGVGGDNKNTWDLQKPSATLLVAQEPEPTWKNGVAKSSNYR